VSFPPGFVWPSGFVFPPGYEFPPGWSPGDPLPGGFIFPPGFIFPIGWKPGDPLTWEMLLQLLGLDEFPAGYPLPSWLIDIWGPGRLRPADSSPLVSYSGVPIIASAGDGVMISDGVTWDIARNVGSHIFISAGVAEHTQAISVLYEMIVGYFCRRSFLQFDLSVIPAGQTVTGVVVNVTGITNNEGNVVIMEGTQDDILVDANWNAFSGTGFADVAWKKYVDPDLNLNVFTLNAAGIAYVESVLGGTAKFCLRELDSDYDDVAPIIEGPDNGMAYSEYAVESFRPYIVVTY